MALRNLLVSIRATANEWSADLKQIQREGKELERSLKPIKDSAKEIGTTFAVAGGAMIATLGVMIKSTVDAGDALRDMSIRTGATVEQLSVLKFAAEQSGATIEDVGAGLRFLSRNAVEAAEGGKQQAQVFRNLGISLKDSSGHLRPVNDLLLDVANRFRGTRDGAEKSAIAMQLFGRGGAALIPLLNEGRAGIEAMGIELDKVGGIMTTEMANAADEFNDQLNLNKKAMDGLSLAVTAALLPALTALIQAITPLIADISKWATAHEGITRAIGGTALALTGTGGLLLGLSGILAILPQIIKGLQILAASPLIAAVGAFGAAALAAFAFREELAIGILTIKSYIIEGLAKLMDAAGRAAGAVGLTSLRDKLMEAKFSMEESSRSAIEMANVLKTGEPIIIKNTKAVEDFVNQQKLAPLAIGKTTQSLQKMMSVYAMPKSFLKPEMHGMFDPFSGEVAQVLKDIQRVNDAQRELAEHRAREVIGVQKELERVTDMRVREILKARAEDDRNWKEQMDIDRRRAEDMFNSVKRTAADTFLAIFKDGEFRFKALGDTIKGIFATLINEILSTMTAKLLTPLVSNITGSLSGFLGKVPGLGGIFGSAGAAAVGGTALGTGGAAAGAGVGGGTAGGAAIAGLATNPITIAAAAGLAGIIAWTKSQAHHEASRFVKTFQDPFANRQGTGSLNKVIDAFNTALAANSLTLQEAKDAKMAVEQLWGTFRQEAENFAKGGKDEALVVRQAFETLGPLMTQIFADMNRDIAKLGETAKTADIASAVQARTANIQWQLPETGRVIAAAQSAAQMQTPPPYQPIINVEIPQNADKDEVLAIITTALETGQAGFLEKWAAMLFRVQKGIVSYAVPAG